MKLDQYIQLAIILLTNITISCLKLKVVNRETTLYKKSQDKFKMQILMRGWLKIVGMQSNNLQQLESMEVNTEYMKQEQENKELPPLKQQSDTYGSIEIPTKEHFFMILTEKDLYILKGRRNDMIKTYKSMSVDSLLPLVFQNDTYSGGLEDMGEFSEGYCFKIENTEHNQWNLCADMLDDKVKWLQHIQMVMKKQKTIIEEPQQHALDLAIDLPQEIGYTLEKSEKEQESFWRIIQQWSTCSRICGGGYQFLQRECVGKHCLGDAILKRVCNEQNCPPMEIKSRVTKLEQIEIRQNRTRLQRYVKCDYKQDDMDMALSIVGGTSINYRVWTVINNHTLSIYMDGADFNTIYRTYNLDTLIVTKSVKDDKCLLVKEEKRNDTLCVVDQNVRESVQQTRDLYLTQLIDFKDNCHQPVLLKKTLLQMAEESLIKSEEQKDCAQNDRLNEIQTEIETGEKQYDNKMKEKLGEVGKFVKMQVAMIKEEQEREKKQQEALEANMQLEKEKGEGLERELLRKERVEDLKLEQKSNNEKITQLNTLQKNDMDHQLLTLKAKIKQMRLISDRKLKIKKQEILDFRTKITNKLLKQDNNKDIKVCCPQTEKTVQQQYCKKELIFNEVALKECLSSSEFYCYNCCENQVGRLYMQQRDACYSQCVD